MLESTPPVFISSRTNADCSFPAGSIEPLSTPSRSGSPPTLTNGFKSPASQEDVEEDSKTESVLSEPHDGLDSDAASETSSQHPTPREDAVDSNNDDSDAGSDEDAEGSDDADFGEVARIAVHSPSDPSDASSPEPSRSKKRKLNNKFSKTESDYFRENAELFGLRHSVRACDSCSVLILTSRPQSRATRKTIVKPLLSSP